MTAFSPIRNEPLAPVLNNKLDWVILIRHLPLDLLQGTRLDAVLEGQTDAGVDLNDVTANFEVLEDILKDGGTAGALLFLEVSNGTSDHVAIAWVRSRSLSLGGDLLDLLGLG